MLKLPLTGTTSWLLDENYEDIKKQLDEAFRKGAESAEGHEAHCSRCWAYNLGDRDAAARP
jgi:hypothetical protein